MTAISTLRANISSGGPSVWHLTGALGVILFFMAGTGLYVFPVFIGPLQVEFGWSMTQVSFGAAISAITMGLASPLIGLLFARFGARLTMLACAAMAGAAFAGYSQVQTLTGLYSLTAFMAFGVAGTTILPAQTLITNWFDAYRSRALGLTMLGIGFGGFLLPPGYEAVIRWFGWRTAWMVAAGTAFFVVMPLIARYVRTHPEEAGLRQDGDTPDADLTRPPAVGLPVRAAVRTGTFRSIIGLFIAQLIGLSALNFHFVPFVVQQLHFSSQQAAVFFGLAVGTSILGRLLFGWLGDRVRPQLLIAIAGLAMAAGPLALELVFLRGGSEQPWFLLLYSLPYGLGLGGHAVAIPILVGRCFGELHFAPTMGLIQTGFAVGVMIGIPVSGAVFDQTGTYEPVLIGCALALVASSLLAWGIDPDKHRSDFLEA